MKADVYALLELSKQHSASIKSMKNGKTQCENEMHNARASFVAAVFCIKSKLRCWKWRALKCVDVVIE